MVTLDDDEEDSLVEEDDLALLACLDDGLEGGLRDPPLQASVA